MATIRIGTFNIENLFARYRFNKNIDPQKAVIDGWRADQRHFDIFDETSKKLPAQAILATTADVLTAHDLIRSSGERPPRVNRGGLEDG